LLWDLLRLLVQWWYAEDYLKILLKLFEIIYSIFKSPIKYLADLGAIDHQYLWYTLFGRKDFLPSSEWIQKLASYMCSKVVIDKTICTNVLFVLCGPSRHLNDTRMSVYTTHAPAGTSVKNLMHFAQLVISKNFQRFDYGSEKLNFVHYNQTTPPLFDIHNIKTPVALYAAQNDWLADPTDVDYLRNNLPNLVVDKSISDYNHLDFLWAINARANLYLDILELMKKY
jgi:lysosomal acid lipase/cholesteryl ester hydrolase